MSTMRRAVIAALATGALMTVPIPATAGGGCHRGPLEGGGTTVSMSKLCFTPSTLRVAPGTDVTFVNKDPVIHNVSAMGWGEYGDLKEGEGFTTTFEEEGLYPFACTYHLAMTGVVVVGDGEGEGTVAAAPSDASPISAVEPASSPRPGRPFGWAVAGVLGMVVGAGGAAFLRRHPQRT